MKKHDKTVSVRIDKNLHEQLHQIATRYGTSIKHLAEIGILAFLEIYKDEGAKAIYITGVKNEQ